MDLGGGQPSPGVVGWREREAVGGIECQRGRRRIGHGISEGIECLDMSSGQSSSMSWLEIRGCFVVGLMID